MSKICISCGCVLDDNAIFCDECGVSQQTAQEDCRNIYSNQLEESDSPVESHVQEENLSVNQMQDRDLVVNQTKTKNIWATVLGVISLVAGIISIVTIGIYIIPEFLAIVCGLLSKRDGRKTKLGKIGFVCGIISIAIFGILLLIAIIFGTN